jgi:hypothetical protein
LRSSPRQKVNTNADTTIAATRKTVLISVPPASEAPPEPLDPTFPPRPASHDRTSPPTAGADIASRWTPSYPPRDVVLRIGSEAAARAVPDPVCRTLTANRVFVS